MARITKAFATHGFFTTNTKMVEHRFGELSTDARTFERDIALYNHDTDKNIQLAVFKYIEDNEVKDIRSEDLTTSLNVAKSIYDHTLASAREIYADELKRKLLDDYRGVLHTFELGEMVDDGSYYCPQYVKFKDEEENEFQIWFSDKSFKSEYDEYTIEVVPPVDNLDIFFSTRTKVEQELAKTPIDVLTKKANARKANTPVTVFRLDVFKWHNPTNFNPELDTNWYILIWGDAGDNIDAVRDKIQTTILANSSHTRDEWKNIFPEIFKRSEFVIVPQWDVFSNENKVKEQASLYSPFMSYNDILEKYGKPFMYDFPEEHIKQNGQVGSLYYRSLVAFTCGSPENRSNKFNLYSVFPDYIDVPSTSTDFSYQTKTTQEWSLKMQDMLAVAESMTPTSSLPREKITLPGGEIINGEKIYTKVIREGKLFLVMRYGHFHYLVAAKYNFKPKT